MPPPCINCNGGNMTYLKYFILGLVQGLTEPLPISSSAHVVIIGDLLNLPVSISLEIWVNLASMLAVAILMFKTIRADFIKSFNKGMFIKLILASIPILITGLLFKDSIPLTYKLIGPCLIITSLLLVISAKLMKSKQSGEIKTKNALIMGLAQSIAIVPGLSRSGTVLASGLYQGLDSKKVLTFSFYLYLIVSFGSFIFSLKDIFTGDLLLLACAFIGSFVMTLISFKFIYKFLNPKTFIGFSIYCLIIGIIISKVG